MNQHCTSILYLNTTRKPAMASSTSMTDLPIEILYEILSHLSGPPPSQIALYEQPPEHILEETTGETDNTRACNISRQNPSIKSISCVNKRWRSVALRSLFCNIIWRPERNSPKNVDLGPAPLLIFLSANDLNRAVMTFTMKISFSVEGVGGDPLYVQALWSQLFSVIDPLRFTIVASPATLAALMNRMLFMADAWSFDIPYHILSLSRPVAASSVSDYDNIPLVQQDALNSAGDKTTPDTSLFTVRPWTSVLMNEGSSVRAYATYEFFLRHPPSMLSALLGSDEYPNNKPLLPPTIVDFNYIAVFPLSTHVDCLYKNLPKLDRLYIQLAPRPSNDLLQDHKLMKHIDRADLWMELSTAYNLLVHKLIESVTTEGNWGSLKVLESGDLVDGTSWATVTKALDHAGVANWVEKSSGILNRLDVFNTPHISGPA